ncbi:aminotransferase class I/II-fold pyridoxal phosphate-dependent enzyme [Mammaliicoccus vitulinus]|uniref:Aminotransferase n=1 Tax=Mammaliicoccus vitulinus TaxID=71237 RepID=A0A2T4PW50_9STAP|nr:aminotransferase class I/II-fold pyridoxal phosphate-dependent enzyme [Mammaliicoccus vitulinus]PTI30700.1 N-acetyl-L,L-diaminopimelate aminotransferase [Mammaliicoccus vitulinus]PTI36940.1 N-acetyl-L,L-diaminopimelate aminotransferase [Mammaliicoccus vitulinus]PTI70231.1 N-acetyl-L,L-diaminopimelate aminotransferase [Mammaliicoccus vitulinus]PTI90112.1 N-acetyl-L,L-diaminopimelate aminotransferase [Mammaliicoccus vitulinus]QQT15780.1 aminotransferase class I/II-fold pyridoxal phosphate-dep
MQLPLNKFASQLQVSGIRAISNRIPEIDDVVNLTVGQPDFQVPASVKEAMKDAIDQNFTSYSHNAGLLELRKVVQSYYKNRFNASFTTNEILITNGASEALDTTLRGILEQGDEVLIPSPVYAGYVPLIELLGAKPIYIDTTQTGLKITPELVEAHITDKTKAILLNYPNNPTGITLNQQEVEALIDVFKAYPIYIVSDEIYAENTFGQPHTSFASYDVIKDQCILLGGLSKSHSMTGLRIGFLLGPEYVMKQLTFVHAYNCICANVPSQYAAIEALTNAVDSPKEMNKAYIERRDYVYKRLIEMGFILNEKPQGAFYIFPQISQFGMDDYEFCMKALEDYHVAIVPGSAFTHIGKGYIRISYAYNIKSLEEGLNRLERMIQEVF